MQGIHSFDSRSDETRFILLFSNRLFVKNNNASVARWMPKCVYRTMQKCVAIFLLLITVPVVLVAQAVTVSSKPATVGATIPERDKAMEEKVAKLFDSARAGNKLPRLVRIGPPDSLKQTVCTIALANKLPNILWFPTNRMSAFYKTVDPDSVSGELNKIASFDETRSPHPARYSVVAWRESKEKGESTYWVGIQLYWSVEWQFFGNYFTDDIEYRNDWKKGIAPSCRGK